MVYVYMVHKCLNGGGGEGGETEGWLLRKAVGGDVCCIATNQGSRLEAQPDLRARST